MLSFDYHNNTRITKSHLLHFIFYHSKLIKFYIHYKSVFNSLRIQTRQTTNQYCDFVLFPFLSRFWSAERSRGARQEEMSNVKNTMCFCFSWFHVYVLILRIRATSFERKYSLVMGHKSQNRIRRHTKCEITRWIVGKLFININFITFIDY